MQSTDPGCFRALLIGIDNYAGQPLSGCVNDINRVQAFLMDKLAVPADCIHRLEAPLDPLGLIPVDEQRLPTYDNLIAALSELSSEQVQRGDRIFIYYSGHGSYEKIPAAASYFEGLVPLDQEDSGLLFDVELNDRLQAIADRSGDLTVVLDCCHAAGATREVLSAQDGHRARFLPLEQVTPRHMDAATARLQKLGPSSSSRQAPQEYTVIAACHADESATECRMPPKIGKPHGLLTYFLFEILASFESRALAELRLSDIWESLKLAIQNASPSQSPMILGPKERRVFGGPWKPQDMGHAIRRAADGSYTIAAGSLAGLGKGAQVAVYGPEPALFPLLNSEADKQARLGVLVIDDVLPAECAASPHPKGAAAFEVPSAARGRLIRQGAPDLLRVAVSQNLDPQVRRFLDENARWDRFVLLPEDAPAAEARVGQYPDGDIWIGDTLFGPGASIDPTAPGPMGCVRRANAVDAEALAVGLRAGLNHYAQYVVPLRVCRNGGFTLPEQAVTVRLLDCADPVKTLQMERNASLRCEARRDGRHGYYVENGASVAFHIHNTLAVDLYVFLMLCNLEGQIEFVAGDVVVRARSGKIFWSGDIIGQPFELVLPEGHEWGIDRLVVIATDRKGMDLRVLKQKLTMNQAIREAMGTKTIAGTAKNPPALRWTAVQTLIQVAAAS